MKLRVQLWLAFSGLFLTAALTLYAFIAQAYEQKVLASQESLLHSQGIAVLEKLRGTYPRFPERTEGYLHYYSDRLDLRLLILTGTGHVRHDSYGQLPPDTPLQLAVLQAGGSWPATHYAATQAFGHVQYVLLPLDEDDPLTDRHGAALLLMVRDINAVYQDIDAFKRWVLGLIALGVAVFLGASYLVALWFTRPIGEIIVRLKAITPQKRRFAMKYRRRDEIRKLVDAITGMVEQLNRYEQRQRQFLGTSSHELRTPLAAMQLIAENLQHVREDPDTHREFLQDLQQQMDKMKQVVDQLLDIHRLWDKPLQLAELTAPGMGKHIQEQFLSLAESKGIALNLRLDPEVRLRVDRDLFFRGLDNLIANAIRYSPGGTTVTVTSRTRPGGAVECAVCDQGIGIREEDQPFVFDPFYRARDAGEWSQEGSGLGLAIVKQMADIHGADIRVQSAPGRGTCMTLLFPGEERPYLRD